MTAAPETLFLALRPTDAGWLAALDAAVQPMPWSQALFAPLWEQPQIYAGEGAWRGERPLGFWVGLFVADEAHLMNLAVQPEVQRQGIGQQLLQRFLAAAKARGAAAAWLEVRCDNHAAIALYERTGFVTVGTRKHYYTLPDGAKRDAFLMCLRWEQ